MTELRVRVQRVIKAIEHHLHELLQLTRDYPDLFQLPDPDGKCPHGNGAKRRCRICQRDYMRDYRAKKED